MGLDMYLYKHKDAIPTEESIKEEIAYWRKHNRLHGYFQPMFKDGEDNCVPLPLDKETLLKLIHDLKKGNLPRTSGFFFGSDSHDKEQYKEDIKIFREAIRLIDDEDYHISYLAWY